MAVIQKDESLELLVGNFNKELIMLPLLKNDKAHLINNSISLLYFYEIESKNEIIIPINSTEVARNYPLDFIKHIKNRIIYTFDKKTLLYLFRDSIFLNAINNNYIIDINILRHFKNKSTKSIQEFETSASKFLRMQYKSIDNISDLVPLQKHIEYFVNLKNFILDNIDRRIDRSKSFKKYNNFILENFNKIELSGITINNEEFDKDFDRNKLNNIFEGRLYSNFRFNTATSRPTNTFNKINFMAIKKQSHFRQSICSRYKNGKIVKFDYISYHPHLLRYLVKLDRPHPHSSMYTYIKSELNLETADEAKKVFFSNVYGGKINKKLLKYEYFKRIEELITSLKLKFKTAGYIKSKLFGKKIYNVDQAYKLISYYIQNYETERNAVCIHDLNQLLDNSLTNMILYEYDEFVFDVPESELETIIPKIDKILCEDNNEFPVRIYVGDNYRNLIRRVKTY